MATVAALWVFFRADSFKDSITIISSVFSDFSLSYAPAFASARMLWLILMIIIVVAHAMPTKFWDNASQWFIKSPWVVKLIAFVIVVQLVIELKGEDVAPFIYFQF